MAISDVVQDALDGVGSSDVADALLSCVISRHIAGTYDPIENTETGGSDSTFNATIVLGEVPTNDTYKDLGVTINTGDIEAYVFKPNTRIVTTDTITVGSDTYDLVFAQESSAGSGEIYTVVLRLNNG